MSTTFSGGYTSDDDHSFVVATTMGGRGWRAVDLGDDVTDSLVDVAQALRNLCSERAAVGMLNIDDNYFTLVCQGVGSLRIVLSDVAVTVVDGIATDVSDELDLGIPDLDEDELNDVDAWVEGDVDILADLGCSEEALESTRDGQSPWASEQFLAITEELGCAKELADVADLDYGGDDDDHDPYDD